MDSNLEKQQDQAPDKIQVPAAQLQILLTQNKELKEIVSSSVDILGFVIDKIFGGTMPEKLDAMTIAKLAMKIPKIINTMDEASIEKFRMAMDDVRSKVPQYLNENQLKQISNGK